MSLNKTAESIRRVIMKISEINNSQVLKFILDSVLFELANKTVSDHNTPMYKKIYRDWSSGHQILEVDDESGEATDVEYIGLGNLYDTLTKDEDISTLISEFLQLRLLDNLSDEIFEEFGDSRKNYSDKLSCAFEDAGLCDNSGLMGVWGCLTLSLFSHIGMGKVKDASLSGTRLILECYEVFFKIFKDVETFCSNLDVYSLVNNVCRGPALQGKLRYIIANSPKLAAKYRKDESVISALFNKAIALLETRTPLRDIDIFTSGSCITSYIFTATTDDGWLLKELFKTADLKAFLSDNSFVQQEDGKVTTTLFRQEDILQSNIEDVSKFLRLLNKYNLKYKSSLQRESSTSASAPFNLLTFLLFIFETDKLIEFAKQRDAIIGLKSMESELNKLDETHTAEVVRGKFSDLTRKGDMLSLYATRYFKDFSGSGWDPSKLRYCYNFLMEVYELYINGFTNAYSAYQRLIYSFRDNISAMPFLTVNEDFFEITQISDLDILNPDNSEVIKNLHKHSYSDSDVALISNLAEEIRKSAQSHVNGVDMYIDRRYFITKSGITKLEELFSLINLAKLLTDELNKSGHTLAIFYDKENDRIMEAPSIANSLSLKDYMETLLGNNGTSDVSDGIDIFKYSGLRDNETFGHENSYYDYLVHYSNKTIEDYNASRKESADKILPVSTYDKSNTKVRDSVDTSQSDFTEHYESDIHNSVKKALLIFLNLLLESMRDPSATADVDREMVMSIIAQLKDNSGNVISNHSNDSQGLSILNKIKMSYYISTTKDPLIMKRMFGILLMIYQDLGLSGNVSNPDEVCLIEIIDELFEELYTSNGYDLVTASEIFSDNILCLPSAEVVDNVTGLFPTGLACFNLYKNPESGFLFLTNQEYQEAFKKHVGDMNAYGKFDAVIDEFKRFPESSGYNQVCPPTYHYAVLESAIHFAMEMSLRFADANVSLDSPSSTRVIPYMTLGDRYVFSSFARNLKFYERHPGIYSQCNPLPGNKVKYFTHADAGNSGLCLILHEQFIHDFHIVNNQICGKEKSSLAELAGMPDELFLKAAESRVDYYCNLDSNLRISHITQKRVCDGKREMYTFENRYTVHDTDNKNYIFSNRETNTLKDCTNDMHGISPMELKLMNTHDKTHKFNFVTLNRLLLTNSNIVSTAYSPSLLSDSFDFNEVNYYNSKIGESIINRHPVNLTAVGDNSSTESVKLYNNDFDGSSVAINNIEPGNYIPNPAYRNKAEINQLFKITGSEGMEWNTSTPDTPDLSVNLDFYMSDMQYLESKLKPEAKSSAIDINYSAPHTKALERLNDKSKTYNALNQVRYNNIRFYDYVESPMGDTPIDKLMAADKNSSFAANSVPVHLGEESVGEFLEKLDIASEFLTTGVVNMPSNLGCSDKTLNTSDNLSIIDPTYLNCDGFYEADIKMTSDIEIGFYGKINDNPGAKLYLPSRYTYFTKHDSDCVLPSSGLWCNGRVLTHAGIDSDNGNVLFKSGRDYIGHPYTESSRFDSKYDGTGKNKINFIEGKLDSMLTIGRKRLSEAKENLANLSNIEYTLNNNFYSIVYDYYPDSEKYSYVYDNQNTSYITDFMPTVPIYNQYCASKDEASQKAAEELLTGERGIASTAILQEWYDDLFTVYNEDSKVSTEDVFSNVDKLTNYNAYDNFGINLLCVRGIERAMENNTFSGINTKNHSDIFKMGQNSYEFSRDKNNDYRCSRLFHTNLNKNLNARPFYDKRVSIPSSSSISAVPSPTDIDSQAGRHYTYHNGVLVPSTENAGIYAFYTMRPIYTQELCDWINAQSGCKYNTLDVKNNASMPKVTETINLIAEATEHVGFRFNEHNNNAFKLLNGMISKSGYNFKSLNEFLSFIKSCYLCALPRPTDMTLNIGWAALKPNRYNALTKSNFVSNLNRENAAKNGYEGLPCINIAKFSNQTANGFSYPNYAYLGNNLHLNMKAVEANNDINSPRKYKMKVLDISEFFARHSKRFVISQKFLWDATERLFSYNVDRHKAVGGISLNNVNDFYSSYIDQQRVAYLVKSKHELSIVTDYSFVGDYGNSKNNMTSEELFANMPDRVFSQLNAMTTQDNGIGTSVLLANTLTNISSGEAASHTEHVRTLLGSEMHNLYTNSNLVQSLQKFYNDYKRFHENHSYTGDSSLRKIDESIDSYRAIEKMYRDWNHKVQSSNANYGFKLSPEGRQQYLEGYLESFRGTISLEFLNKHPKVYEAFEFFTKLVNASRSNPGVTDELYKMPNAVVKGSIFEYIESETMRYYMAKDGLFLKTPYHRSQKDQIFKDDISTILIPSDSTSTLKLHTLICKLYEDINQYEN